MDPGHHQQPQEGDFGDHHWAEMASYGNSGNTHTSPVHEYTGFQFNSSPIMPIEPQYNMTIPPPYTSHQQLQPLIMPQWPSMLASQPNYSGTSITSNSTGTPISANSASSSQSNHIPTPVTTTSTGSTPRRTLTDADRRAMCLYHQEHPTVKQTEIGAMFGVERSTVSKVLRLKDKFLSQDDGSQSPVKKSKNKFPDIDRALSNWLKNQQKRGKPVNDAAIRERARQFAASVGNDELRENISTASWLERFKSKNNIGFHKVRKTNSQDPEAIDVMDSSPASPSQAVDNVSPLSPIQSGLASPTISPDETDQTERDDSTEDLFDFSEAHKHEQSPFGEALASLPQAVTSPTSPFWPETSGPESFSPTSASGRQMPGGPPALRPRSQTFPNLSLEPGALLNNPAGEEPTPKYSERAMSFELFESPLEEHTAVVNPLSTMKRNNSVPNVKADRFTMQPPPIPPIPRADDETAESPTHDDARRALEVLMTFFQNQPGISVDPQDFVTIGKLMEKLKLAKPSPQQGPLPGGFHHVDEYEHESPRMRKKRSIRSL